jgi:hypothetical protein
MELVPRRTRNKIKIFRMKMKMQVVELLAELLVNQQKGRFTKSISKTTNFHRPNLQSNRGIPFDGGIAIPHLTL